MITQHLLAELDAAAISRRAAEARAKAAREEIILRHEAGEKIEPGELTLDVKTNKQQRLSWDDVLQILGEAAVAKLRAALPFIESTRVQVRHNDG